MAKTSHRIFAIVGAVLFLLSSVALTAAVLFQIHQTDKANKAADPNSQANSQTNNQPQGAKLQGTKLTGFTPVDTVDKLIITDQTVGTGPEVKSSDTVTANYTGALAKDGTIFESSLDSGQPATFPLSGVIQGWQEGVPGMKVGGKRRLLIPAAQAYGSQAKGSIPANSDLVFDIELVKIGQ